MGRILEPPDVRVIFDKPGRQWSPEERLRVIEWLHESPQHSYLMTSARRHLGPAAAREDEEDLWQGFCLKGLNAVIVSYDPAEGARFWGYLLVCFMRLCWEEGKKIRKRSPVDQPWPEMVTEDGDRIEVEFADPHLYSDPYSVAELNELLGILNQCINELPWPYRQVILLHYFEEQSIKEIAEKFKISDSLVKIRLFRARQNLRVCLRKKGWMP